MLRKLISIVLLLMVLMTSLTGCGMDMARDIIRAYEDNKDDIKSELDELKDAVKSELHELESGVKDEVSDWLGSISQYALTEDESLKGERKLGADDYVGSYKAEYNQFGGEEYIFGGTSVERENGSTLKVTYSLDIQSGTAALYWLGSADEHIIFGDKIEHMITEVTAEDVYEFTFDAGDNFIVLKGDDFTGSLSLDVE